MVTTKYESYMFDADLCPGQEPSCKNFVVGLKLNDNYK
jgi:hypothetical protein